MIKNIKFVTLLVAFILLSHLLFAPAIKATEIDNTTYSAQDDISIDATSDYEEPATVGVEDSQDSSELSVSNMINIVLIAIGIVLILLGIAIIIKLK